MARRPPTGLPPSAGVLAKYVRAYARHAGLTEGRVRGWISYMVMAGALERSAGAGKPRFIVKGGVAMELRLRARARATKDLDVVLQDPRAELTRTLEDVLAGEPYQGFHFRRKGEPLLLDNGTEHVELAVTYRGGAWTTIAVDIARAEAGESEVEWLPAIPLDEAFGISGPTDLPCLPLRLHIAQKFHGMTLPPRPGRRNDRFRDLIDLLLMEELVTDYEGLRDACETVFRARGTHEWPPGLAVPEHWIDPFQRLARDLELPVTDAADGLARVRAFLTRILETGAGA